MSLYGRLDSQDKDSSLENYISINNLSISMWHKEKYLW